LPRCRVFNAFEAVLTAKGKAEIEFKNETGFMTPTVVCWHTYFVDENKPGKFKLPEDIVAGSHEQINRAISRKLHPQENAEAHADLDRAISKYNEVVAPHEAAEDAARDICGDGEWDLLATVPTTLAGLAAVLRYRRELEEAGNEMLTDSDTRNNFLPAIEEAVCTFAGLPAPPVPDEADQDQLADVA
jgi:hypothetical protein